VTVPVKPPRPDGPSERNGRVAGERSRAALRRLAAVRPHAGAPLWRAFAVAQEETVGYGRWRSTVTVRKMAADALGVDIEAVRGYERDHMTRDLRKLDTLGVVWYWPGQGRNAWAMIELPPAENTTSDESDSSTTSQESLSGNTTSLSAKHDLTERETRSRSLALRRESDEQSVERARPLAEVPEDQPDDLESRLVFALRANGNAQTEDQVARECRGSVARACTAGLTPDEIDALIRDAHNQGVKWTSEFDKLVPAKPKSWASQRAAERRGLIPAAVPYVCSLELGCDNGWHYDSERDVAVECECLKQKRAGAIA
jgi:hypothetical protein